jgi:mono/diheme cytochrome c family protein
MRSIAKSTVGMMLGAVVPWLAATAPGVASSPDGQAFEQIQKGHYLANAADCFACHTQREGGKPFAGGRPIETPFGNITSPNITPDNETGIGAWTDNQFVRAVREGRGRDGSRLYPAMPYTSYTKMSRADVLAIRAYLKTIQPVHRAVQTNTLPFPFNIRAVMRVWDALYFTPGEFKPDPKKSAVWNRGAFLVEGPGHCSACHTPKSFLGGDDTDAWLGGGKLQGWFAPDITGGTRQGLGYWTVSDIATYLKTGHNGITAATGPMAEEVLDSTSKLNDSDRMAMATYLRSLPSHSDPSAPKPAEQPVMAAGQAIYRDECSACHGLEGKGTPQLFPALAHSSIARANNPSTAIRLVLRGVRSVATEDEPTAPGMPSFGWQLNDAQVAAVLTYIGNTWNNAAAPVTADQVKQARKSLSLRNE